MSNIKEVITIVVFEDGSLGLNKEAVKALKDNKEMLKALLEEEE